MTGGDSGSPADCNSKDSMAVVVNNLQLDKEKGCFSNKWILKAILTADQCPFPICAYEKNLEKLRKLWDCVELCMKTCVLIEDDSTNPSGFPLVSNGFPLGFYSYCRSARSESNPFFYYFCSLKNQEKLSKGFIRTTRL